MQMASLNQVKMLISFALSQMSTKNRHHSFEELCFEWANKKICSNLTPATGPVSAGGDQGYDFETFTPNLNAPFSAKSSLIDNTNEAPIVFACSTAKEIIAKIKRDLVTITNSSKSVKIVHYFSTQNIEVSKRHRLVDETLKQYKIVLQIYDLQFLAHALAQPDVFWIAVEYLDIAPEIHPNYSPRWPGVPPKLQSKDYNLDVVEAEIIQKLYNEDKNGLPTQKNYTSYHILKMLIDKPNEEDHIVIKNALRTLDEYKLVIIDSPCAGSYFILCYWNTYLLPFALKDKLDYDPDNDIFRVAQILAEQKRWLDIPQVQLRAGLNIARLNRTLLSLEQMKLATFYKGTSRNRGLFAFSAVKANYSTQHFVAVKEQSVRMLAKICSEVKD
jgi:hypothetical protein